MTTSSTRAHWPALIGVVLLLGACATGAPPRPAQVHLPASFGGVATDALSTTSVAQLDQWWRLYDDSKLNALVTQALSQGFSVREAQARLDESRALRSVALARFGVQGGVQGNAEVRNTQNIGNSSAAVGTSKSASVSLPVSWEMDFFGRRSAAENAAIADVDAALFDVAGARAAIAAEVARALFQARGLNVQRDEAQQTLRIQRELLDVVTERARRGLAASSEADRVAADLALAQAQAEDLDAALAASRRALLVVIGDGGNALDSDDVLAPLGTAPQVPVAMPGDLLARRPDVRIAQSRIQRAAGNVRLAELDFFPRFTLNPGVGLSAQRGAIDSTTSFWSLAAGLTVPVLDRPRLKAQLRAEGARAEQSVLAYERTVQTAFSEADQSLTRLRADRRRVDTLTTGETRAQTAYAAARKRYELGFANLQELLDSERAWRATRSALTGARLDALLRSVQVFQALGGGWDSTDKAALAQDSQG